MSALTKLMWGSGAAAIIAAGLYLVDRVTMDKAPVAPIPEPEPQPQAKPRRRARKPRETTHATAPPAEDWQGPPLPPGYTPEGEPPSILGDLWDSFGKDE